MNSSLDSDFRTVYESNNGLNVRLEAAPRVTKAGTTYLHHRLVTADGHTGTVIIAQSGDEILVVSKESVNGAPGPWEFPRGSWDKTDTQLEPSSTTGLVSSAVSQKNTILATGLRELREETGYTGKNAKILGEFVSDSSIYPQKVAVVFCAVDSSYPRHETDGEISSSSWVSPNQLRALVAEGHIADGHTLSAIALWLIRCAS